MHRSMKGMSTMALVGLFLLLLAPAASGAVNEKSIGSITAIEGEVYLSHKGDTAAFPAMLGDPIYLYDHIQTERQSRVQILFQDESLFNLAENTYIQITEHIYSPEENRRSSVFRLLMGKVRAIVGRYFKGAGSGFKVSTPTAIIGVRGTHFVVDATLTDETTVVCIDSATDVVVRNIQEDIPGEVTLTTGLMTKVLEGVPPSLPTEVPDDLMMRLLMDTRVMLPTLQGGPAELRGLSGEGAAATAPEVTEEGKMPPVPVAPDEPLFQPIPPSSPGPPPPPPPPPV
ncbi:MAG: FecR domain-containing protein [Thermodesulfobacteriota bacterium]